MFSISMDAPPKSIMKHIKYKLDEQQYIETETDAWHIVQLWILVYRYDAITPFGKEGQEGPPPLPPDPWRDRRLSRCRDLNARQPTSWGGSEETMEIVALPGSTNDRRVSPWPSLFNICDDNVTLKKPSLNVTAKKRSFNSPIAKERRPYHRLLGRRRNRGNIITPTVDARKYGITSCGLWI